MTRNRLEAFTDAVIAIAMTIMVLELKAPRGADLAALRPLAPIAGAYVLSFINLGIYWNNHHHMLSTVDGVNGAILWANLHLLFWLSLFPFATAWMGQNNFPAIPTLVYGLIALGAAVAYYLLKCAIVASPGAGPKLAAAVGRDLKGKASPVLYLAGIGFALANRWISLALYVLVTLMWLVPDRRIEVLVSSEEGA